MLLFTWLSLALVGCGQAKPKPTLPPRPTILHSIDVDAGSNHVVQGAIFDIVLKGFLNRTENGLGSIFPYQYGNDLDYLPTDNAYLLNIWLPRNLIVGSYRINQTIYMDYPDSYVMQPDEVAAMFMYIHEEDRGGLSSHIDFDRGTYFAVNLSGNVTIANVSPLNGTFTFSGQDDSGNKITISGKFTGT